MDKITAESVKKLITGKQALCIYVNEVGAGEVVWSCSITEMCYLKATLDLTINRIMDGELTMQGKNPAKVPKIHS